MALSKEQNATCDRLTRDSLVQKATCINRAVAFSIAKRPEMWYSMHSSPNTCAVICAGAVE